MKTLLAVPHRYQRPVEGVGVRVDRHLQLQPGTAGRGLLDRFKSAVEHLEAGLPGGRGFPGQIDAARFERRIGERLDLLDLRQRRLGYHAELQRVPECGRVVLQFGKLLRIHRTEGERDGIAVGLGLGIRHAPFVGVPVAEFHPADGAAARLAVFGQMLFGPAAAPVFQPDFLRRGGGAGEMHNHLVNLARVLPHHAVAFGQRQAKGRGVKGRGPERQAEARDGKANQPDTGTGKQGMGLKARFHEL